jgi:hypothetical protein
MDTKEKSGKFKAGRKLVVCSHCGSDRLVEFSLNRSFIGLLFGLQCCDCKHIEFFADMPEEVTNVA